MADGDGDDESTREWLFDRLVMGFLAALVGTVVVYLAYWRYLALKNPSLTDRELWLETPLYDVTVTYLVPIGLGGCVLFFVLLLVGPRFLPGATDEE